MVKPDLGNKHECHECGAKFYDLNRPQPSCPKCGYVVDTSAEKQKSGKKKTRAKKVKKEPEIPESTVDIDVDASGIFDDGEDDEDEDDDDLGVEEVNLSEENAEAMLSQLSAVDNGDDEVVGDGAAGAMNDLDTDDDFGTDDSYNASNSSEVNDSDED